MRGPLPTPTHVNSGTGQPFYKRLPALSLEISPMLAGDYNNDGMVNIVDYVVWRDNLGSTTARLPNDPTPNLVSSSDYDIWRDAYSRFQRWPCFVDRSRIDCSTNCRRIGTCGIRMVAADQRSIVTTVHLGLMGLSAYGRGYEEPGERRDSESMERTDSWVRACLVVALRLVATAAGAEAVRVDDRPNILVFVTDDQSPMPWAARWIFIRSCVRLLRCSWCSHT